MIDQKATEAQATFVQALGPRPLVVVGLSSVGKTRVGYYLAEKLGVDFVDTDFVIERENGASVKELARKLDLEAYRRAEAKVVLRILGEIVRPTIIALGGGAFSRSETRVAIERKGVSVWLHTELDQVQGRLTARSDRDFALKELELKHREIYSVHFRADFRVEAANRKAKAIAADILKLAPDIHRLLARRVAK